MNEIQNINNNTWQVRIKRYLLSVILLLVCVLLSFGVYYAYNLFVEFQEKDEWERIYPRGSMEDYELFMKKYPSGKHYLMAKECYLDIKKNVTDWVSIKDLGNPYLLKDYISKNSESEYVNEARNKLDSLMWANAVKVGDIYSYQEYLNVVPEGKHISRARAIIDDLEANILSASQKEQCMQTLQNFYNALSSHDETNLLRCISDNIVFQGKKANRSNILSFLNRTYSEDVNYIRWSEIDAKVSKSRTKEGKQEYMVSYMADVHINRDNQEKMTYAYYECMATLNEDFKIVVLNMRRAAAY